jgi:hypothetical protein
MSLSRKIFAWVALAGAAVFGSQVGNIPAQSAGNNPFTVYQTPQYGYATNVQGQSNEGHQLRQEAAQLLQQYGAAEKDDEKSKIRDQLETVLEKEFDLQKKQQDAEIERIEQQLEKLKAQVKKRNDARKSIVERRLDQLTQEAEGLGWNASPSTQQNAFFAPGQSGFSGVSTYYPAPVQVAPRTDAPAPAAKSSGKAEKRPAAK